MNGSIFATVFYCLAWLALASGLFLVKKTEKKTYLVTWVAITFLMVTCYQTLMAAILNTIGIPINIISIGILDFVAAFGFWFYIWKKKELQKYCFEKIDAVFCVALLAVLILFWKIHCYGMNFYINYGTIDPAAHLKAAIDVIQNQCVNNMFYSALFNGLFLELFLPFRTMDYMYQPFVLSDIINWGLAGLMFFGTLRRYMTGRFAKIAGVIVALIYMYEYPLNSILYGFVYLGMGVTVVVMLIELTTIYLKDETNRWFAIVMLSLACLALFECYVLFMPVTYFAIITCIFVKQHGMKKLVSKDTIVVCLSVFLIPCIIGLAYTYFGLFKDGLTVAGAINEEGGIYRELYSNYLPFLPLALYEFVMHIKEKKNQIESFLFVYLAVFMVGLFTFGMMGRVSSYYFYKTPFLLWVPLMILCFKGACRVAEQMMGVVISYFIVWFGVFAMFFTGFEGKIQQINTMFDMSVKSGAYNDIFAYNYNLYVQGGYPYEKMEIYHWVYNELLQKGEDMVAISSWYQDDIWFQAITNQRLNGWDFVSGDHIAYYEKLKECGANYVVVLTDEKSQIYQDNPKYWDSLEKVYENGAGFVAKLDVSTIHDYYVYQIKK